MMALKAVNRYILFDLLENIRKPDFFLVPLLLTMNRFHTLFWCRRCWLWTSKYQDLRKWYRRLGQNITLFPPLVSLVSLTVAKWLLKVIRNMLITALSRKHLPNSGGFSDQAENWIISHHLEDFSSAQTHDLKWKNGWFLAQMSKNAYFLYFKNSLLDEFWW